MKYPMNLGEWMYKRLQRKKVHLAKNKLHLNAVASVESFEEGSGMQPMIKNANF
jgi:hypothetical protein